MHSFRYIPFRNHIKKRNVVKIQWLSSLRNSYMCIFSLSQDYCPAPSLNGHWDIVLFHCAFLYTFTSLENLSSTLSQVSLSCTLVLFHKSACQSFSALSSGISGPKGSGKPLVHKVPMVSTFSGHTIGPSLFQESLGGKSTATKDKRKKKIVFT